MILVDVPLIHWKSNSLMTRPLKLHYHHQNQGLDQEVLRYGKENGIYRQVEWAWCKIIVIVVKLCYCQARNCYIENIADAKYDDVADLNAIWLTELLAILVNDLIEGPYHPKPSSKREGSEQEDSDLTR